MWLAQILNNIYFGSGEQINPAVLGDSEYTILGTVVGLLAGLCVATIALAGEKK